VIIDYRADPSHAGRHSILDAATGRELAGEPIYWADDGEGAYRVYVKDGCGRFFRRFADAATGQPIEGPLQFWRDADGTEVAILADGVGGERRVEVLQEVAWEERRRPIRIVPREAA
jgi:hypothetical protein